MRKVELGQLGFARFWGYALLPIGIALLAISALGSGILAANGVTWEFQPQGWVRLAEVTCQVQVSAPVGFHPVAWYRYTTEGRDTLASAGWRTDNLQIAGALTTTKVITVSGLLLPDSADRNWIQFRLSALDGSFPESDPFAILVDATRPQNPTLVSSASHIIGRWSNNPVITMNWSGASDATSGIVGYSYLFDTSPSTVPDAITDTVATTAVSQPLNDGDAHYFHVRALDGAGNWAAGAAHAGPYYIDTTPPNNPAEISSSSHSPGVWSSANVIHVNWSPGSDSLSGVGGYSFVWDDTSGTMPDVLTDTLLTSSLSPPMPDSDSIWFHLRTVDRAGNGSAAALHLGPFRVDTQPPVNPSIFQTSHITDTWSNNATITVAWERATDAGSGVAGYSYTWDNLPFTVPEPTVRTTDTIASISGLAHGSRNYFHLRTGDKLGHWSSAVHLGPFLIDTQPPTPPSGLSAEPSGWTNRNNFTLRWQRNPLDTSGIGAAYCQIGRRPTSADDYYVYMRGNDIKAIPGIRVSRDGSHDAYVWLEDRAGNSDYSSAFPLLNAFKLDTVPPISSHRVDRDPDHGGWYTSTVTVYLFSQDPIPANVNAVSGVAVISYTIDGGPWRAYAELGFVVSGEGEHVIQYFAMDHAGNREVTRTVAPRIKIDLTPPHSYVAEVTGVQGKDGWFISPVQVVISTTPDQGSRVTEIWHRYRKEGSPWSPWTQGNAFTLSEEGVYSIQHYAVDQAGHREAVQDMPGTIKIDLADPITTHALSGLLGRNGWYKASPVQVVLYPSDATSGISQTLYIVDGATWRSWGGTPFTVQGDGVHTVEYYSIDRAGNRESNHRLTIGIDSEAPAMVGLPQIWPEETWHNRPDFSITWRNPPQEVSGVGAAYYKFNDVPRSNYDYHGGCVATTVITRCTGVAPPREGKHGIAVWLEDLAGNVDYTTRRYVPNVIWYDRTAPTTSVTVHGSGQGLWYSSPVTLTFQAVDPIPLGVNEVSGVRVTSYSVGCGPVWTEGISAHVEEEGRTTVCFRSQDNAGNVEEIQRVTLRIDRTPPANPSSVNISPAGWSANNAFTISWVNTLDASGIARAFYSHQAPRAANEGIPIPNSGSDVCPGGCAAQISVPGEGVWDLYFWLQDGAGNSNWQNPLRLPGALRYDATAPSSQHRLSGVAGRQGWWRSPVTLTLTGQDDASGVAEIRYRLRQPPDYVWEQWRVYTQPVVLSRDGTTDIKYYAVDEAGNWEMIHDLSLEIDTRAPTARVVSLPAEIPAPSLPITFSVTWDGSDPLPGSGLAGFTVQHKDGLAGTWTTWLTGTLQQRASFLASPGHVYYFRARAKDVAGNSGSFASDSPYGDTRTYVQAVVNGEFDTAGFVGWQRGGVLQARRVISSSHEGMLEPVVLLGRPELGRGFEPTIPIGFGAITQTVTVPRLEDLGSPTLSFWYRVFSYDVVWASGSVPPSRVLYDSFDAHILAGAEPVLVVRDGNYGPQPGEGERPVDTGWRRVEFPLTPYAGQTIKIRFACHNRNDNYYNTWAYVDDIRITGRLENKICLPTLLKNHP